MKYEYKFVIGIVVLLSVISIYVVFSVASYNMENQAHRFTGKLDGFLIYGDKGYFQFNFTNGDTVRCHIEPWGMENATDIIGRYARMAIDNGLDVYVITRGAFTIENDEPRWMSLYEFSLLAVDGYTIEVKEDPELLKDSEK